MKKLLLTVALLSSTAGFAFNAQQEFQAKCQMCHTLGAQAVGPDLLMAIPRARKFFGKKADKFFLDFMKNPAASIQANPKYVATWGKPAMNAMPPQPFNADQVKKLIAWIESQKK